jgi:hypothetical protein
MKLNIPPISQRDPAWGEKLLGNSRTSKIKDYGCLLVCHCMLLNYYGYKFTPDTLNELYKSKKVFGPESDLINFWAVQDCFSDIKAEEYINCQDVPAPLEKIDSWLAKSMPVIAQVDFSTTVGLQSHFVLIIGKDNDYFLNDPWTSETYYFTAKYGDPAKNIYGLRLYSGNVPQGGDTIESLHDENKKLREQLSSEMGLVTQLRTKISQLEGDLAVQEKENERLLEDNKKAEIDKGNAERALKTLQEEHQELQQTHQAILGQLVSSQAQELEKTSTLLIIKELLRRILRR